MLARLHVVLPYEFTVPEGEVFMIYPYDDSGYQVVIYPPIKTDRPLPPDDIAEIKIDDKKAFRANGLKIDFFKNSFDRSRMSIEKNPEACDPSYEFIKKTINAYLAKIRFFTRGASIQPIELFKANWRLQYLNDDATELPEVKELIRERFALGVKFSWIALDSKIWDQVHKDVVAFEPPEWDKLMLDAQQALPHLGQAIVLVATALEVFISDVLNQVSARVIQKDLWNWINKRDDLRFNPTVEEQYDVLLKVVLGYSLKENTDLWEAFSNIKTARNKFVHEGRARVGGKNVTEQQVQDFIGKAYEIIELIKNKLPLELQWPAYRRSMRVEVSTQPLKLKKD